MYKLYDYLSSGNSYKVRLLLQLLDTPYERIDRDIMAGETRSEEFLRRNPNGRIPLLELGPDKYLAESNAILCYLANGTDFLPDDRYERALALQWMFFEQYSHEPYIAVARFWLMHLDPAKIDAFELEMKQEKGRDALAVMETHLSAHDYFVAEHYTVADIALYAYTHVANEGGFDLAGYPAVRAWLDRVAAHPRHISISTAT